MFIFLSNCLAVTNMQNPGNWPACRVNEKINPATTAYGIGSGKSIVVGE